MPAGSRGQNYEDVCNRTSERKTDRRYSFDDCHWRFRRSIRLCQFYCPKGHVTKLAISSYGRFTYAALWYDYGLKYVWYHSRRLYDLYMEFKGSAVKKMYMLPISVPTMYLCKFLILTIMLLIAVCFQNMALAKIGVTDLPKGTFEAHTLISFAGYSFLTSMPVLSFMLFIASRFENMWVPLGIGVAGFLSGMALATSEIALFMVHPFVVMLKPAIAMSAQPDIAVVIVSMIETILFLCAGLWSAKKLRYE